MADYPKEAEPIRIESPSIAPQFQSQNEEILEHMRTLKGYQPGTTKNSHPYWRNR